MSTDPLMPRFVFVTDHGLFKPTLVSAWGVLRHLRGPGELHFWGDGLSENEWADVARVAAINPSVTLHPLSLQGADLDGAKGPCGHISGASMGRLHIPSKLTGRVLYMDGDTCVTADLSPLFAKEQMTQPIAAVRDFVVAKWCARGIDSRARCASRVAELRALMQQDDLSAYFNSGVLLLDTDAIRAEPALLHQMQDVHAASACPWGDQDHLNRVFVNRVQLLNPAYNASWGRTDRQRKFARKLGAGEGETAPLANAIWHFHGPNKPWHKPRYDLWRQRARSVWQYRREWAAFKSTFPNL
ncbi:lipopolysaccharide 3-alpha-galactosyltransferase [Rhodobacteraceae bacterium]|nr:lipopolysaccharide 3-alpha-galactosyltransferase [Paracoccaceae bacterium]